jgi:ankyrin repeat domain-containing protein 50
MLLDRGADINAQGGFHHYNALEAASRGGCEEVVQMLFDRGADINAQGNALQAAPEGGHEKVQMLLDRGVDVNAGNALQAASEGGHEKVVKMLLDRAADINAQGGFYGSALQAVSAGGWCRCCVTRCHHINQGAGQVLPFRMNHNTSQAYYFFMMELLKLDSLLV